MLAEFVNFDYCYRSYFVQSLILESDNQNYRIGQILDLVVLDSLVVGESDRFRSLKNNLEYS